MKNNLKLNTINFLYIILSMAMAYTLLSGFYLVRMQSNLINFSTNPHTKLLIIFYLIILLLTLVWLKYFGQLYRSKSLITTTLIGLILTFVPVLIAGKNINYPLSTLIQIITSWQLIITYLGLVLGFALGPILKNIQFNQTKERYLLFLLFLISFSLYAGLAIYKQNAFLTPGKDTGIFDQAIWNLSLFHAPASTIRGYSNLWADHFHPILILLAPLFWIYNQPIIIALFEIFSICLGVFPIYTLTKKYLHNGIIGLALALTYVFFGGIQHGLDFGFYPEMLLIPLVLFLVYFLVENKKIWAYIFLILALATKEDSGLSLFILGLAIMAINKKWRKHGFVISLVSIAWSVFALKIAIPHFIGSNTYQYWSYREMGNGPGQFIKTLITKPYYSAKLIFSNPQKVDTLLHIFGDFGFLPIASLGFLIAIPYLFENFFNTRPVTWGYGFHYQAMIAPYLVLASIFSLYMLKRKWPQINLTYLGYALIIIVIFNNYVYKYPAYSYLININKLGQTFTVNTEIKTALKTIPSNASVSAQNTISTHLSHREKIYMYPQIEDASYIVLSDQLNPYPLSKSDISKTINNYRKDSSWQVEFDSKKIIIFKKVKK